MRHRFFSATAISVLASTATAQVAHFPAFRFGEPHVAHFGRSIDIAGDVDGDGYDDIIVGAIGDHTNGSFAGSAWVYSGYDGSLLHVFRGDKAGDYLGLSVSGAGDVNGDGFDDVIVGVPGEFGSAADHARVYSGVDGAVLLTFMGTTSNDNFGSAVSGAGDVNNDGFSDLIVGAPAFDLHGPESGLARVFSGSDGAILFSFYGETQISFLGDSVSGVGDIDQDGFDDVVVGAPGENNYSGAVRVYSGHDGSILYTFHGDSEYLDFGFSVSGAGDVNGDGVVDVIVGAPSDNSNGSNSGLARVFSGADGAILYTFYGDDRDDFLGRSVSGAGDIDGDGFADLIVGAPGAGRQAGLARVFSGRDGSILYSFEGTTHGPQTDHVGQAVAGGGDINGDGIPDFVIAAPGEGGSGFGESVGRVRVYVSQACPGDSNDDGVVDVADLNAVLTAYGQTGPALAADVTGDLTVNFVDLNVVLGRFGAPCPE